MLCRTRSGEHMDEDSRPKKKFGIFSRLGCDRTPYKKMGEDLKKDKKREYDENANNCDKKKKKKKGWKRFRQAALTTCRYIGLGAAGISPTIYTSPEYSIDPKHWNRTFNCKPRPASRPSAWASGMMMGGLF